MAIEVNERIACILTVNTILYCRNWKETVAFYAHTLGFAAGISTDWLVEFKVNDRACLSVADASRTSVQSPEGRGITVTFEVGDVQRVRDSLIARRIDVESLRDCAIGGKAFFLRDPEGHRLEFWSNTPPERFAGNFHRTGRTGP